MDASKYLSGIDLQPVSIETAQGSIPGYELKMRWLDIGQPDAPRIGDPFLIVVAACDWVVEIGPGAGAAGGRVVSAGPPPILSTSSLRS